jgi:hypothetical protein
MLAHRIGAVEQLFLQRAVGRLAWGFEDRAVAAEEPAVIAATKPLPLDQSEFERGAAMRAVQLDQPDLAAAVAKRDEVLAEDFKPLRHVAESARKDHRLPEPPQVFAARRTRPDSGQLVVHRRHAAVVISAISLV